MFHGGKSTGPKSKAGRERCAEARTVHGWETRKKREYRAEKFRELKELEVIMRKLEFKTSWHNILRYYSRRLAWKQKLKSR